MNKDVLLYYDERMLDHDPVGWDPEHPEWTNAVKALLVGIDPERNLDSYQRPERPDG